MLQVIVVMMALAIKVLAVPKVNAVQTLLFQPQNCFFNLVLPAMLVIVDALDDAALPARLEALDQEAFPASQVTLV